MTRVTWENTVHVSPTTAEHMGLEVGDIVEVEAGGRKVRGPVWVAPGHADECATLHFGYGSQFTGHVAKLEGFDVYPLRTTSTMWTAGNAKLTKTGDTTKIAATQDYIDYEVVEREVEKREVLRVRTLEDFKRDPHSIPKEKRELESEGSPSIYDAQVGAEIAEGRRQVGDYAWGMVIDLSACTSCGACVTACIAENNIPVVGKEQVHRGRVMHWIRLDRYFEGPKEDPRMHSQPVPCMQCENAPCELVCPVEATTHSPEGLNEMTYNRCVGTRYCSNNCPYKVRRFNFLLYSDYATETLKMQRNPDVSVRSRGVMEKCTYCVQRINTARIAAKREDRKIKEGEVVTACQQVCPASAITFGDIRDPQSAVAKLKSEPHDYALLGELQTRPRTTYLAKIRNPNPDLETA
jgi:molybdopterin-containing oxidoreductase family iron-sulfur binding subunit